MNDELIMQTNNVGDTSMEMGGASYLGIGPQGQDGITPTIGDNGNWYLGSTDTGKPSRGEQGTNGADGADGANGKSAYESAQDGGYTGTEVQFNSDLADVGEKIGEAPDDGQQYARKNKAWAVVQGGGGGTGDHTELSNRDAADQHPVSAITGLNSALNNKLDKAQGASHAGEFLVVGSEGEVTTQAFSVLTGGSY